MPNSEAQVNVSTAGSARERDAQLQAYTAIESKLCGHGLDWLRGLRRSAMDRYLARGFPNQRQESWKYTSSASLARRILQQGGVPSEATVLGEHKLASDVLDAYQFAFVDGWCVQSPDNLPEGITAVSLSRLLMQDHPELKSALAISDFDDTFALLNSAYFTDGIYLSLRPNAQLDRPIYLRYFTTQASAPVTQHLRNIIRLGAGSNVKIIESYQSIGAGKNLTNTHTTIALAQNSHLEHVKLQCEAMESLHMGHLHVTLAEESRLLTHSLALGSQIARNEIDVELKGKRAGVILNGFYLGTGRQHHDQQLQVYHMEAETCSEQAYFGVLDGHAKGIFKGRVDVDKSAQRTDARQVNRNLLLSEHAEAVTLPQLQIQTNDVKCSHGATIGQLSEDALFYLRSRGIDAAHARALLTRAFASEVLTKVEDSVLRGLVAQTVNDYLPDVLVS